MNNTTGENTIYHKTHSHTVGEPCKICSECYVKVQPCEPLKRLEKELVSAKINHVAALRNGGLV